MAKESRNLSFSKACITEEDGDFVITETLKDSVNTYNLSEKLREYLNVEGISLKIAKDDEIPSEE